MAEIIYRYHEKTVRETSSRVRWISDNELSLLNEHLSLCSQRLLDQEIWNSICSKGSIYCLLFENGVPVARACVEKYSEDTWEVADVRVVRNFRNRGYAYDVCSFVLQYILNNGKNATIRTEEDNSAMKRVIEKLGFTPLS
ncbi:MAG: GNAT family N-acetyltransferase [Clostridia bacterium]|nr:GNAT family N-acetyltransferase [Clostridia bacterium]